jgi:D-alanyl-D-alanine endopeptidase (penicillin-binding protein 7)
VSISVLNVARLLVAAGVALILAVGSLPAAEASASKARTQQARPAGKVAAKGPMVRPGAGKQETRLARNAKTGAKAGPKVVAQPKLRSAGRPVMRATRVTRVTRVRPASAPSMGQIAGLRTTGDDLDLSSSVALVVDRETDAVVFSKNADAVLPIASITKLMTALVVADARLPLGEMLEVAPDDVAATNPSRARSRLALGTQLTRGEMLHLALMSSENRAAHVLGRTYPGGLSAFVSAMNAKAALLGMADTRYVEPTGLSADNRSSAQDLARLVRAASDHPVIREYSTAQEASVEVGSKTVQFRNTNGLVRSPDWDILVQKTGYIAAAGRCVVMQAQLAGRELIMVLLDSAGKYTRIADAERIRKWIVASPQVLPFAAKFDTALPAQRVQPR